MKRHEVPTIFEASTILKMVSDAEEKSYGVIVNSFNELEPASSELYRRRRRACYVGPVSLCNEGLEEKKERGQVEPRSELAAWLAWLDDKPASSVLYVCFGSHFEISSDQVKELALGLEASGCWFVWAVRGDSVQPPPARLEEMVGMKVLVIRGWAPQLLILGHVAIGGFLTHCGWNSTLEGISAGVPMVTWPLTYEQFVNEKFLNKVVRLGVRVRGELWDPTVLVGADEVAVAVTLVMSGGDEAEERRRSAYKEYAKMARAAMRKGGSSYADLSRLIDELITCRAMSGGNALGNESD